ncbi:MAG: hypothetical protein CMK56_01015 [Proteobacteria bacterium]|nr:hypothetical protein [Pseudomonadota bacterium]
MDSNNKALGGYLELELSNNQAMPQEGGKLVNSGRAAFELALISSNYSKIHIPYFTCPAILEPLDRLQIPYEFYSLSDSLEPNHLSLSDGEALVYVNYFGLMGRTVAALASRGLSLIVDNCQALFESPIENIPTFYSPRKFVGVPDGGIAQNVAEKTGISLKTDTTSLDRCKHLLVRTEFDAEEGYSDFLTNEASLSKQPMKSMSNLSQKILRSISWDMVELKRFENFRYLHSKLGGINMLSEMIDLTPSACPLTYPLLHQEGESLRQGLLNKRIYIPKYWPGIESFPIRADSLESKLMTSVVALPIDQRYGEREMLYLIDAMDSICHQSF